MKRSEDGRGREHDGNDIERFNDRAGQMSQEALLRDGTSGGAGGEMALVVVDRRDAKDTPSQKKPASALDKGFTMATGNALTAVNLMVNGKLFVDVGQAASAAGSLTTTIQALSLGVGAGALLGIGYAVSGKIKTGKHEEAGEIVSASICLSGVVALGNGVVYGATNLLPLFIAKGPADAAADYFNASLTGVLPALVTVPLGVFFTVTGNGTSSFAAKCLYRGGSSALAYLLVHEYSTAASVGYANGIAPWAAATFTIMLLQQEQFKKYKLGNIKKLKANYSKHGKLLIKNGKRTAYLRLTEWINLASIALFFHPSIAPMNASIQYLTLANLIVQGIGFGAGMHVKGNRDKMTALHKTDNPGDGFEVHALHRENINSIMKCLIVALIISGAATCAAFTYDEEICNLFLHEDESTAVKDSAKNLLQINAMGLPFDAIRMVLGSSLNGYNEMMFQSNNALVLMTGVGVVLSFVVQQAYDYPIEDLFWVRNATILASAVLNGCKLLSKISDDVDTFCLEGVTEASGNKQGFKYSQAVGDDDHHDGSDLRRVFHTAA